MITASVERLTDVLPELQALFDTHYKDLALNQDQVPLDPMYDDYLQRDAQERILLVSLRKDGQMIGYFVSFIAPSLHYKTCLTCTMDIVYVMPEHRGNGMSMIRMLKVAKQECKRRGVQRWFVGSKLHKDIGRIYEAFGFQPVETYYSMMLGD